MFKIFISNKKQNEGFDVRNTFYSIKLPSAAMTRSILVLKFPQAFFTISLSMEVHCSFMEAMRDALVV
jgi:hypothetical protein